jgi:hypothetical protein
LITTLPSNSVPPGPLKSNGSPAKLTAILLFGLAVISFFLLRRSLDSRSIRPGAIILLIYFFLLLLVYGVGLSNLGSLAVETTKTRAVLILIANCGVGLYAMTRIRSTRQRSIILGCLAVGLTFNCIVGMLQPFHVDLHLLLQPPGFVVNTGDQGRGGELVLTERFGAQRAFGTSTHAIEFSVVAAAAVPLAMHFARFGATRQVRLFATLGWGIALLAIPSGVSRSGLVALAAAMLVYMWTFKVRQVLIGLTAIASLVFVEYLLVPNTVNALWKTVTNSAEDESVQERVEDYATVSRTFRDHPIFGLGLGGAPSSEYGFLDNEWLQAIVQGGAIGMTAMLIITGGAFFGIAAALRKATNRLERDQAYAIGAMLTGIIASSFTFDLFGYQQVSLLFFILFGLIWSTFNIPWSAGQPPPQRSDHAHVR